MTLITEFCDTRQREVTRTYAATFEDVIYCIRNCKMVRINVVKFVDGKYQGCEVTGYFEKYDQDGIHFYDYGCSDTYTLGHEYTDYIEVVRVY